MSSQILPPGQLGPQFPRGAAPVRVGDAPPLADCFSSRPDTGPGPADTLLPGQTLVLTPPGPADGWPGGTGKTQYAAYLAESLCQARQIDLAVWVTASSRASVLAGYTRALAETAGPAGAGDAESLAARFVRWLATTSQRWLMVLDDLADSTSLDGLWPEGPFGRVVITTRDTAPLTHTWSRPGFPVGPFSPHEALGYLASRLSSDPDQRVGAVDLLEEIGREPLALAQATATMLASGMACRDYRELFLRRRHEIAGHGGAEPSGMAVTWTLAVEQADQFAQGGIAQSCLALAALLDSHGIPGAVFTTPAAAEYIAGPHRGSAVAPEHVRRALLGLERTGLLTAHPGSAARSVQVHPAVQAAVRSAMPDAMRDAAVTAAASALLQAWPADGEPWLADALRSCAASLAEAAELPLWRDGCHAVLLRAGESLDETRMTGPAVGWWQKLASASEQFLGTSHPDTVRARERLARASLADGQSGLAVELAQQNYDIRVDALGSGHPAAIAAGADLGHALLAAGRAREAIAAFEEALRTRAGADGADDVPDTLAVQDGLATAYRLVGRLPEAIDLLSRTLAEREECQGPDHPDTIATRAKLARACLADGQTKEAVVHGERALADRERVLGRDHPATLAALATLAASYHGGRHFKRALPLYERALEAQERVLGPDHPDVISTRGNLASVYHSAGRINSAVPLYERTRTDCQRVLGPDHPDTLAAQANLAHGYDAVGRLAEATQLLSDTLADCERVLPPEHPLTAAVRDSLAAVTGQLPAVSADRRTLRNAVAILRRPDPPTPSRQSM